LSRCRTVRADAGDTGRKVEPATDKGEPADWGLNDAVKDC